MIVDIIFNFSMPSELLAIRRTRLEGKFLSCYNLLNYFLIIKTLVHIQFCLLRYFYVTSFCQCHIILLFVKIISYLGLLYV